MPELVINGSTRHFDQDDFPANITAMLAGLKLNPAGIVAEVGGELVSKDRFADYPLNPGDNIEIVQMVGGG